jgi:transposase
VQLARNNRDFAENECGAVMKYVLLKGNSAKKNYMSVALGDKCPYFSTVKTWVAKFRTGHLDTEDEESSGRPTQVTIPENVDAIHSMILNN